MSERDDCDAYESGYERAILDVVALLRSKRTLGGESIVSAEHAADVIERGDATGFADKKAPR